MEKKSQKLERERKPSHKIPTKESMTFQSIHTLEKEKDGEKRPYSSFEF